MSRVVVVRVIVLAVFASLVIAYHSSQWFAGEVDEAVDYVRDRSDSAAMTFADAAEQNAATLRCLSCLGNEADAVVDAILGYGKSLTDTSTYMRLEQYGRSLLGGMPCNLSVPAASSDNATPRTVAVEDATPATDRPCG